MKSSNPGEIKGGCWVVVAEYAGGLRVDAGPQGASDVAKALFGNALEVGG